MEKKQKVGEEEKAKLALVSGVASLSLKAAGYPALIAIGIPQGIHAALVGDPKEVCFGETNFGFKVLLGLVSAFDALTEEEQDQITQIASDAMKRKIAAGKAAEADAEVSGSETFDSSSVGDATSGEEAQHG